MTWQKFQNTNQRFEDRISISPNNAFGFPTKFYLDNNLESYSYLVIYYNQEDNDIGFQFTSNEEEKHKFRLVRSKGQYGVNVTATSFFKSYSIDAKAYKGKYKAEKKQVEGIGDLFVIHLKENSDLLNTNEKINQIADSEVIVSSQQAASSSTPVNQVVDTPETQTQEV